MELDTVLRGKGHVGEYVMLGDVHAGSGLGPTGAKLIGDVMPGVRRGGMIGLKEDLSDRGGKTCSGLRHMRQRVPHEVHTAGAWQEFRVWGHLMGLKEPPIARWKDPVLPDALLDRLPGRVDAKSAFDGGGRIEALTQALADRALNAERDPPLLSEGSSGNGRNGYGKKTVLTEDGSLELSIPRDRPSSFNPQLLAKDPRRFPGFDDKILSMDARGMSLREILAHVQERYGVDVSPDLISGVTDAVLDARRVTIRNEGTVRNAAAHVALGVRGDGTKQIPGL